MDVNTSAMESMVAADRPMVTQVMGPPYNNPLNQYLGIVCFNSLPNFLVERVHQSFVFPLRSYPRTLTP